LLALAIVSQIGVVADLGIGRVVLAGVGFVLATVERHGVRQPERPRHPASTH
jgi:hypothetical protein